MWHLATREAPISRLKGVGKVLDDAGIDDLPQARTAVLVGTNISPNQPLEKGGKKIHTLWGRLAYELLGEDGYEMKCFGDPSTRLVLELCAEYPFLSALWGRQANTTPLENERRFW